jgi:hypothetical protein
MLNNDEHYNFKNQKNIEAIILIYTSYIYFGNVPTLVFCVFHSIHNVFVSSISGVTTKLCRSSRFVSSVL